MTEQTIFCVALEIDDPIERANYLTEVCGSDGELRRQVESLLAAHERSGEFLEAPAIGPFRKLPIDPESTSPHSEGYHPHADAAPGTGREETEPFDDVEVSDLTFLQPSSEPGSLGRLGHYEVRGILGRGGFGVVLKAFDESLHRVVAIKVLAPELAATSPARKRFLREARAAAAVRDENIVHIYAVEEQPLPHLVMEYVAGETLQQRIDRTGPFEVPEVLRLGRQIAAGIEAAHAKGLVHRDIKPSNILLEGLPAGRARITDFGLARAADDASLTRSGVIAGTPMYMSPEQATGGKIDHRADLFSLGSVLYVMCSGRPPFRASTTMGVLKRVAEDVPRPIPEIIPEVPHWLCDLIGRLHAKNPDQRFASASEVAALLASYLAEWEEHGRVANPIDPPSGRAGAGMTKLVPTQPLPRIGPVRHHRFRVAAPLIILALAIGAGSFALPRREGLGENFAAPQLPGSHPSEDTPGPASRPSRADQRSCAEKLGVPVVWENSIGMKLALVPPGKFTMGSPEGTDRSNDEGPSHEVAITRPYYAGIYPVTVGQFESFVKERNYRTEAETNRGSYALFPTGVRLDPKVNWRSPNFEQAADHPVVCVSWNDARAFCAWLTEKEGKPYALPTEAQWEYACRAGSMTRYYFGDDSGELGRHAWYRDNAESRTHPVGLKSSNPWGLHDVHGLVWQWTGDWYAPDYYKRSLRDDPPGPIFGKVPVQRGGSWMESVLACRSAARRGPSFAPVSASGTTIGFRVVLNGGPRSGPDTLGRPVLPAIEGKTGFLERIYKDADGTEHKYWLFVPHDYRDDRECPVILFLHGAGELEGRGSPPVDVGIGPAIKKREGTFPFLVVIPQALKQSWQAGSPDANRALSILDAVCNDYKTDKKRIYLTGLSLGGYGTWSLATANPDRWAAIAPICGGGSPKDVANSKHVPCWCFHGDADTVVPVQGSRAMIDAFRKAGGEPRYTEYPGVGHRCWDRAYGTPDLFDFFLQQRKN